MKPRITTSDIARAAGVHQTTVSLALRGDRRLRPETIAQIRATAEKLGYVPDPMLTALASYRRSRRPSRQHSVIAWVTNWSTRQGWRSRPMFEQFHAGAARRASELGYRLEEFWLNQPGLTPRRASEILHARGVQGLILAPQPDGVNRVELDWRHFSVVTIGPTLRDPVLHLVSNDQFHTVVRLCQVLVGKGYRRIGYAIERHRDQRMYHHWSAAFERFQRDLPPECRTTPYEDDLEAGSFGRWLRATRPDVVFGCEDRVWNLLQSLQTPRRPIPDFALIGVTSTAEGIAGMDENAAVVGATAVERLTNLIHLGDVGVPATVTRTLLDATWVEGPTARKSCGGSPSRCQ